MPELPGILGCRRNNTTPSPDVSEPLDLLIKGEASKKSQTQVSLDAMEEPPVVAPEEVIRSDDFERRTLTGSEPFSLSKSLEATKLALLRVSTLVETMCPKICSKSRFKSSKSLSDYIIFGYVVTCSSCYKNCIKLVLQANKQKQRTGRVKKSCLSRRHIPICLPHQYCSIERVDMTLQRPYLCSKT